ncbi:hypothetical protein AJ79_03377 [Helicocarpus griseus UAMH5409]|uniref:Uncharacterized protein n=1 Tax=Helicocarpus griseus UAMH5409 TaxID=1447875 RepID=A0A2B7XY09_9EURO|nr:hypothetical protein AJ79_03377 [Helicocarpus griseus UAMH5409]
MGSTGDTWATEPIAIVGLSCRFAGGASSPGKLWEVLEQGKSAWSEIPSSRFNATGSFDPNHEKLSTMHVRGGHFLNEDIGLFDAAFFNYSVETASTLDPQFRLQLESVYEALENSGLPLSQVAGSNTSVFAGIFVHDYRDATIRDEENLPRFFLTGMGSAMASNRISHFFNFRGASMTIDTGCSSTLVALHQAVQSLRRGESDMSIVGGSNLLLNPDNFKAMGSLGILSPDGKCFTFDARANGYGRGEGVATIVIKRLRDVVAAGDPIRAVIRETFLNQDGKTETITSPSQAAQIELMRDCYSRAGLNPLDTQYFEAHGTGTATGDPIEAGAVAAVFQSSRWWADKALRIGSVKTNIGHTEAASGLASVIKAPLAMERGVIPPTINFETPNPKLALDEWHLKVATELEKWPAGPGGIRRASINNFGYGGSNAHVIIEYEEQSAIITDGIVNGMANEANRHTSPKYETKLLILSAKDEQACQQMVFNLKDFLAQQNDDHHTRTFLENLVYTLGQRRTMFPWIAAYPVPMTGGIGQVIKALDSPKFRPSRSTRQPRIGMVFTGQGASWYAMGRELVMAYPVFKSSLEEADAYLREFGANWSLTEELLHRDAETTQVNRTAFSIPICVAVQISLVRLLRTWGITPSAVTIHSSGEIAAAYTVGAISYRVAMGIAYYRSALAADMVLRDPVKGGMIVVGIGRKDANRHLERLKCGAKAVVACVNSPQSTTVAGDLPAIQELETLLQADSVFVRRLRVETAYHSHHMSAIADGYSEALHSIMARTNKKSTSSLGSIAYASPVTGYRMSSADIIASPDHWVRSLVQPVEFVDAFTEMVLGESNDGAADSASVDLILEVGPHTTLGCPIQQILEQPYLNRIRLPYYGCLVRNNAVDSIQALAANLLREGYPLDIEAINFPLERSRQVCVLTNLPSYPWNHQTRHWVEPRFNRGIRERSQPPHHLLGSLVSGTNLEAPSWRHILRPSESPWVRDHAIQSNILYPGCGFVCLAIEAITQQTALLNNQKTLGDEGAGQREISGYLLRDVTMVQALVVPDTAEGIEIQMTFRPVSDKAIGVRGWTQFEVSSITADNQWYLHAQGLISVEYDQRRYKSPVPLNTNGYVRRIDPDDMWNVLGSLGIQYGPAFKNITDIVQSGKEMRSQSNIVVKDNMPGRYLIHPIMLDAAAQTTYTALPGTESRQDSPRVFQSIEKIWISSKMSRQEGHRFQCHTLVSHADARGIESNILVVDPELNEPGVVLDIEGLTLSSLGGGGTQDESKPWEKGLCTRIKWACAPDMTPIRGRSLSQDKHQDRQSFPYEAAAILLRQIAHKNPRARILEVKANIARTHSILNNAVDTEELSYPLALLYHFTSASSDCFEDAGQELATWSDILAFDKLDIEYDPSAQGFEVGSYDAVIWLDCQVTLSETANRLGNVHSLLKPRGKLLLVGTSGTENKSAPDWDGILQSAGFSGVEIFDVGECKRDDGTLVTSSTIYSTANTLQLAQLPASDEILLITSNQDGAPSPKSGWLESLQRFISRACPDSLPMAHDLQSAAKACTANICVFLCEMERPLLRDLDAASLEAIKTIATTCKGLLWVTRGGAVEYANPDLALATGFLRSLRNEYLGRPYLTLDLDPNATLWSDDNASAIVQVLTVGFGSFITSSQQPQPGKFEYAVRDGNFLIPRLFKYVPQKMTISPPEAASNPSMTDAISMQPLHQPERPLCMYVGMPGLLDTLTFDDDPSVRPDGSGLVPEMIEVEPRAYGVNFRDVMVAMGQLRERVMGLECAGIITRAGSHAAAHGYNAGDRVFCLLRGPFGSLVRIPWTSAMHMPATGRVLSFEEAASLPVIFCTAYISLVDLARLQPGQTVLIHAAAGGVGQAAIMMARHLGAGDIFVTVGTPEKRELVMKQYGIPPHRIFSSRDTSFAADILAATNGRGVDVIINSLAGPLLQESFNVLAPFGHFVEIGKRDLEANSHLEMRPFGRQVSFSAFYLLALIQYKPREVHRVMAEVARLVEAEVLVPVHPVTAYSMCDVIKAFRLLQAGKHTGKVVLSAGPQEVVPVRRRAPVPRFSPDASYLLVGGVGGIGRSIAHWMVAHGARNLILLSRSAGSSKKTAAFVDELKRETGCRVKPVSCDVSKKGDLAGALRLCEEAGLPAVRGVIQAAMVLQDAVLEKMTAANYQACIQPKVHGSWNLHQQFNRTDALDFFVILSSVVGVAGNTGQCNYSAAGSYQDALAGWRVAHCLPAVSIDLGAVKAIGVAAETTGVLKRLNSIGLQPVSEDQVLAVLGSAILAPYEPQVVVGLNSGPGRHWDSDGASQLGRDARFAALKPLESSGHLHGASDAKSGGSHSLASKLAGAELPEEAIELVGTAIAEKLSEIFMIPVADIELKNKPAQYGIDSLVAVELRNMLVQQAAAEVSIFDILQSASLAALAAGIAAKSAHAPSSLF